MFTWLPHTNLLKHAAYQLFLHKMYEYKALKLQFYMHKAEVEMGGEIYKMHDTPVPHINGKLSI